MTVQYYVFSQQICKTVPSLRCDLEGYVKCEMGMVPLQYNVTVMTEKNYTTKVCEPTIKTVKHIKKMPECKNVTKHNCVTKWEVLPSGEKVRNSTKILAQGKRQTSKI